MAFPTLDRGGKAVPVGPTGILSSNRPQAKAGGKRTLGGSKGITGSPMKKSMSMGKRMGKR